ncbi:hypothetical protein B0H14DRAFT_3158098 [Mycena olivaceomarginata]|nr:hypothetical protein B0H14DRAFT_3158098 [Mycena olivaceomarginata]
MSRRRKHHSSSPLQATFSGEGEHRSSPAQALPHHTLGDAVADRYSPASERALPHRHALVFFAFRRTRGVALHLLLYPDLCLVHSSPGAEGRSAYLSNARYTPSSPSSAPANGSHGRSSPPHSTTSPRHSAHLPMHLTPSSLSWQPTSSAGKRKRSPPPTTTIPGAEGRSPSSPSLHQEGKAQAVLPAPLPPSSSSRTDTANILPMQATPSSPSSTSANGRRRAPPRLTLPHTQPAVARTSKRKPVAPPRLTLHTSARPRRVSSLLPLFRRRTVPSRPAFSREEPRTAENRRRRSICASSFPGVPPAITLRPGTTKEMDTAPCIQGTSARPLRVSSPPPVQAHSTSSDGTSIQDARPHLRHIDANGACAVDYTSSRAHRGVPPSSGRAATRPGVRLDGARAVQGRRRGRIYDSSRRRTGSRTRRMKRMIKERDKRGRRGGKEARLRGRKGERSEIAKGVGGLGEEKGETSRRTVWREEGGMHGNTLGRTRRGGTRAREEEERRHKENGMKAEEAEVGTNRKDAMGKARIREGVTHRIDSYTYMGTCIARRRTERRSFPRGLPDLEREGKRLRECSMHHQRGAPKARSRIHMRASDGQRGLGPRLSFCSSPNQYRAAERGERKLRGAWSRRRGSRVDVPRLEILRAREWTRATRVIPPRQSESLILGEVGCLSGSLLVLPPPAPPVDNSPPPEPETQKDSEPTELFASVVIGPPPRTLPPPRRPLPPPPPATASSSTKSKTAGSKKAEPHATYTTHRNLYLAVYALDVGGSTAEFSERWKALEQEKPPSALFQKKASAPRPSLEDIRKHINTVTGTSAAV